MPYNVGPMSTELSVVGAITSTSFSSSQQLAVLPLASLHIPGLLLAAGRSTAPESWTTRVLTGFSTTLRVSYVVLVSVGLPTVGATTSLSFAIGTATSCSTLSPLLLPRLLSTPQLVVLRLETFGPPFNRFFYHWSNIGIRFFRRCFARGLKNGGN